MGYNSDYTESDERELAASLGDMRPAGERVRERAAELNIERRRMLNSLSERPPVATVAPPKRIIVERTPTPKVSQMLDDSYHCLAKQLHQYRVSAHVTEWETPKVAAFAKLVNCLVSLQESERKNDAAYRLSEVDDEKLSQLASEAEAFVRQSGEK